MLALLCWWLLACNDGQTPDQLKDVTDLTIDVLTGWVFEEHEDGPTETT